MKKKPAAAPEPASDLQGKIREAEFKNILQKLKDGKTLTAREAAIAAEFAAERDGNSGVTQVELAALWGITQPAIHKMVKMGMPMDSIESATEWRKKFLAEHGRGGGAAPAGYNEARTRKALLECDKLDMQLAILRGDYEEKAKVREAGIRIGAIFSAKLAALVNDASGALAGLGEAELRKKLHERTQQILSEIRDELEKL
jgi:predicted transcriptional regulator